MTTHEPDYGHAAGELTATPWLAHLAGLAAAAAVAITWILAMFVAPEYLQVYRDEAVVLPTAAQLALTLSNVIQGAAGWIVLLVGGSVVFLAWNRARTRGGASTAILIAIAAGMAIAAVVLVLACSEAGHLAQDASGAPR